MALIRGQPAQAVQKKPFDFGASMAGAAPAQTLGRGGIPASVSPAGVPTAQPIVSAPVSLKAPIMSKLNFDNPVGDKRISGPIQNMGSANAGVANGLGSTLNTGMDSSGINAPNMVTVADAFKTLQPTGLLPTFKPISSFGDEYYDNLFSQAQKRLNDQYFGANDSLQARQENQMNSRGLVGSGIEQGGFSDLLDSFGSQVSDVSSSLATERAKNDIEAARYNSELENKVKELTLGATGDEAKRATDFLAKIFDTQVKDRNQSQDIVGKRLEQLTSAMGNQYIDPETRDYFESIFGSDIGNTFGTSMEEYNAAKQGLTLQEFLNKKKQNPASAPLLNPNNMRGAR